MFRRHPGKPGGDDASAYSRRSAAADSVWSAQDRIRSGFGAGLRGIADVLRRPFEGAAYSFRMRLLWPLQDRAATMGAPARVLSGAAVVVLAAGAATVGLLAAGSGGSPDPTGTQVAVNAAAPAKVKSPPPQPAEPTLQGAAPVFEPAEPASEVDPAKAIVKSAPEESSAAADTAQPSAAAASSAAKSPEVDGPPAGPEAIAVARDFASAFVLYETGETDSAVRRALGESATPALAGALLKRPPRLPANVEVPKAKVVNVVAAPSHGDVYPVSVSLLRVGLTSELRLDMEQRKDEGWRVTNVLG